MPLKWRGAPPQPDRRAAGGDPVLADHLETEAAVERQVVRLAGLQEGAVAVPVAQGEHRRQQATGMAAALLERGADPEAMTFTWFRDVFGKHSGQTPLHWASESGYDDIARLLLDATPWVVGSTDERGATPAAPALEEAQVGPARPAEGARGVGEGAVPATEAISWEAVRAAGAAVIVLLIAKDDRLVALALVVLVAAAGRVLR